MKKNLFANLFTVMIDELNAKLANWNLLALNWKLKIY